MDQFLRKINEYGLIAIDGDAKIITDIKEHLNEYSWQGEGFQKIKEALYRESFRMVLIDKSLFEKKFNISKKEGEMFKVFLHKALVNLNGYDNTLQIEIYNLETYADDTFETHIENNFDFYENWMPGWKMKRKFNKEKTEQEIFEKVKEKMGEFYRKFEKSQETKGFVDELERASIRLTTEK